MKWTFCLFSFLFFPETRVLSFELLKWNSLGLFHHWTGFLWCGAFELESPQRLNLFPFVGGRFYGQITSFVTDQVKLCQKNVCLIVSTWWAKSSRQFIPQEWRRFWTTTPIMQSINITMSYLIVSDQYIHPLLQDFSVLHNCLFCPAAI